MNRARKLNRFVRFLSLFKVPLLGISGPTIVEMTDEKSVVKLPLKWLTKNHLGSMYFGALAMGAELSVATQVLSRLQTEKIRLNFIFKNFKADFLKRAETDVLFCCDQVAEVNQLIDKALSSNERVDQTFSGRAVSSKDPSVIFMTYEINISLKNSSKPSL